jgi:hypothetical protein
MMPSRRSAFLGWSVLVTHDAEQALGAPRGARLFSPMMPSRRSAFLEWSVLVIHDAKQALGVPGVVGSCHP